MSDYRIKPCGWGRKCVSSLSAVKHQWMEPIILNISPEHALKLLGEIIRSIPRSQIVEDSDKYIYAVFITRFFRFKDDTEFLVDEKHDKHRKGQEVSYG